VGLPRLLRDLNQPNRGCGPARPAVWEGSSRTIPASPPIPIPGRRGGYASHVRLLIAAPRARCTSTHRAASRGRIRLGALLGGAVHVPTVLRGRASLPPQPLGNRPNLHCGRESSASPLAPLSKGGSPCDAWSRGCYFTESPPGSPRLQASGETVVSRVWVECMQLRRSLKTEDALDFWSATLAFPVRNSSCDGASGEKNEPGSGDGFPAPTRSSASEPVAHSSRGRLSQPQSVLPSVCSHAAELRRARTPDDRRPHC